MLNINFIILANDEYIANKAIPQLITSKLDPNYTPFFLKSKGYGGQEEDCHLQLLYDVKETVDVLIKNNKCPLFIMLEANLGALGVESLQFHRRFLEDLGNQSVPVMILLFHGSPKEILDTEIAGFRNVFPQMYISQNPGTVLQEALNEFTTLLENEKESIEKTCKDYNVINNPNIVNVIVMGANDTVNTCYDFIINDLENDPAQELGIKGNTVKYQRNPQLDSLVNIHYDIIQDIKRIIETDKVQTYIGLDATLVSDSDKQAFNCEFFQMLFLVLSKINPRPYITIVLFANSDSELTQDDLNSLLSNKNIKIPLLIEINKNLVFPITDGDGGASNAKENNFQPSVDDFFGMVKH